MQRDDTACRDVHASQVVTLKMYLVQHLHVLQSWYNVASNSTWKSCMYCDWINLLLSKNIDLTLKGQRGWGAFWPP